MFLSRRSQYLVVFAHPLESRRDRLLYPQRVLLDKRGGGQLPLLPPPPPPPLRHCVLERELTAPRVYSYNARRGQFPRTRVGVVRRMQDLRRGFSTLVLLCQRGLRYVVCVSVCVCLSPLILVLQAPNRLMSDTNSSSATSARKLMWRFR